MPGYPGGCGCCNNKETCSTALFSNGVETKLERLTFYPEDTADQWDYTEDWGVSNPVYQHNAGYEATPAGSFTYTIKEKIRAGAMDFKLSFRVYPLFKASNSTFISKQVGGFIANAFVVWIDFDDRAIYWGPTDEIGTIPEEGTLVKSLPFNGHQMLIEVFIFRNEKGTWNLQFHDTISDLITPVNLNFSVEWDKSLPGLEPGPITFGGTIGEGGGGIGSLALSCGSADVCNQCWDGLPMSWSIDFGDPAGDIAVFPTVLPNYGVCAAIGNGSMDDSVHQAQIGSNIFGPIYLQTKPVQIPPVGAFVSYWFALNGNLWYPGGNVTPSGADKMYLVASVAVIGGDFGGDLGSVIVAAWTCPWESFCCYGRENIFTKERLFEDGVNFGGETPQQTRRYFEQYDGWPDEVKIKSIGPPDDMPCTQTCVYRSKRDPITKKLVWELLQNAVNSHVFCPGDAPCPQPPMDPQRELQYVYLPCSE